MRYRRILRICLSRFFSQVVQADAPDSIKLFSSRARFRLVACVMVRKAAKDAA